MELTAIKTLKLKIELAEQKLLALRENAQSVTSSKLDGLPRSQSFTSKVERLVIEINSGEEELARLMIELIETTEALTQMIQQRVKGKAAIILIQRYVLLKPFKVIAASFDCSEGYIYRLHRQGVRSFSDKNSKRVLA